VNAPPRPPSDNGPAEWLYPATLVLIAIAPSQLAYAFHPRYGPFVTPADVLAALLGLGWLIDALLRRRLGQLRWLPLPAIALVVVAALSIGQAADLKAAVVETAQLGLYLLVAFILFFDVLRDRSRLLGGFHVLAGVTTVIVLWGAYEYLTAHDPMAVKASFGNRNVYSAYLAMVLPVMLGVGLNLRGIGRQVWLVGAVMLGVITMLSGPIIWVTLVCLLAVGAMRSKSAAAITFVLVVAFTALMPVVFVRNYDAAVVELSQPYVEGRSFDTGEGEVPVVEKRWLEWGPALRMMADGGNFVLGVGAGNYQANIGQYYENLPAEKDQKIEADTNNLYLVIGGSLGFAGLVCLAAWLAHFWRLASVLWLRAEDEWGRGLAIGLVPAMGAIIATNFFTSLLVRGSALVLILLLAMIEGIARRGLASEEVGADSQ